jgi:enamine deaminase RidA (YjgF/YER057c/UK114 family)
LPGSISGIIAGTTSRRRSAGGLIFCSGMLPVGPETGERRHGTLTSEAHVIVGNLKLLLESAVSLLDRLVQVHALIYDSIEYDVLNRVYRLYAADGGDVRCVTPPHRASGCRCVSRVERDHTAGAWGAQLFVSQAMVAQNLSPNEGIRILADHAVACAHVIRAARGAVGLAMSGTGRDQRREGNRRYDDLGEHVHVATPGLIA